MALGRTFSFEEHDEQALSSNEQERSSYQHQQQHSPYRDPPARDIISPPPLYASPPPRDAVSPPSPFRSPPHQYVQPQIPSHYSPPRDIATRRPVPMPSRHSGEFESAPPPPPPHRSSPTRTTGHQNTQGWRPESLVTPEMDNFGYRSAGGGLDRITQGVADRNPRESGMEAMRGMERSSPPRGYFTNDRDMHSPSPEYGQRPNRYSERASYASTAPLAAGAATPGTITPRASPDPRSSHFPSHNIPLDDYPPTGSAGYHDSAYQNSSIERNAAMNDASINPYDIADDGDDGFIPDQARKPRLNLMNRRSGTDMDGHNQPHGSYMPQGTRGASMGALGGILGRTPKNQTSSGSYNPVGQGNDAEKASRSDWLSRQTKGNNKMRWVVGGVIITVIVLATVAGIIGGVVSSKKSSSSVDPNSNDNTAAGDLAANGDLDKDSPQIKALLNNDNLHKVFPGMDYTPWGTQYPLCMTYPPSQNNVTRDMAVMSQLTNAVRLYGTDCNQTQMVLHSIDRLGLTDMKIWLGVWIDTNDTTTERQLAQMYTILEETPDLSIFKGAIIGNEALYRAGLDKASSESQLIEILTDVKANFTKLGYTMPVATSDLGDNWNAQLVTAVDFVMSNIHPFFAGVSAAEAAGWTWDFWDQHDKPLTAGLSVGQVISETGWPSDGGRDCGGTTGDCTGADLTSDDVAIAGIDEMNTYLDTWVCQALENGTEYFWFEAFDEPWKVVYNTEGKEWEDKWGLFDPGRNLKDGLVIPDCGGKTVSS